ADICPARLRSVTKSGAIHQRVVQDQIRAAEPVDRAQREQVWIAGACADQRDETSHATSRYSSLSARSSSGLRRARATPSAFQWVRSSCATSAQDSRSSGSSACSASRSRPASAGARPSVDTATVTPPLRNTPPSQALAESVSSTALTNTRTAPCGKVTATDGKPGGQGAERRWDDFAVRLVRAPGTTCRGDNDTRTCSAFEATSDAIDNGAATDLSSQAGNGLDRPPGG